MIKQNAVWFVKTETVRPGLGQYLYFPSEAHDYLYQVKTGKLNMVRLSSNGNEEIVATLATGDLFGELAPERGGRAEFGLEAVDDLAIRILERAAFQQLIESNKELALAAVVSSDSSQYAVKVPLSAVLETAPTKRLALLALQLGEELGIPTLDGRIEIPFKISGHTLVQLTGLSESLLTEALSGLITNHMIDFHGHKMYIRNRKELEKIGKA
jgi:CRP/FNR family transcriptional regulator